MISEDRVVAWLAEQKTAVYLVGGCIRDRLLDRPVSDLDLVVAGDSLGLARKLADHFEGQYFPLDADRGTGRVVWPGSYEGTLTVDISRLQGDLAADLAARDFTVNALAADVRAPREVIDHHGGLEDLADRALRPVSETSIGDDPLRAIRAVRLAYELGLSLTTEVELLIRRDGRGVAHVAGERVRDEFCRLLAAPKAWRQVVRLHELRLLTAILPELAGLENLKQPFPHHLNALAHTLETLMQLESLLARVADFKMQQGRFPVAVDITMSGLPGPRVAGTETWELFELLAAHEQQLVEHWGRVMAGSRSRLVTAKMAALLHDAGKPASRTVEEGGRIRFIGHDIRGMRAAGNALRRLRLSGAEIGLGETIVRHHMRPLMLAAQPTVSSRAVYRFFRDAGDAGVDVLFLALADHRATYAPDDPANLLSRLEALTSRMLGDYWERYEERVSPPRLVDGRELMQELGLKPGPQIGNLLEAIREGQAAGEVLTRVEALDLARSLLPG